MQESKIARIISEVFNGTITMILTPIIAIVVSPIGTKEKVFFSLAYILAALIPYLILKALGKISDYEFTKREERPPYFITISILFGVLYLITKTYIQSPILPTVALALFVSTTVMTMVTFFWKISGHMTYSTLFFCTMMYLSLILHPNSLNNPSSYFRMQDYCSLLPLLLLFLIATPLIAWSRVKLKKHTVGQVIAGTLVTLTICILIFVPIF